MTKKQNIITRLGPTWGTSFPRNGIARNNSWNRLTPYFTNNKSQVYMKPNGSFFVYKFKPNGTVVLEKKPRVYHIINESRNSKGDHIIRPIRYSYPKDPVPKNVIRGGRSGARPRINYTKNNDKNLFSKKRVKSVQNYLNHVSKEKNKQRKIKTNVQTLRRKITKGLNNGSNSPTEIRRSGIMNMLNGSGVRRYTEHNVTNLNNIRISKKNIDLFTKHANIRGSNNRGINNNYLSVAINKERLYKNARDEINRQLGRRPKTRKAV